MSKTAPGPKELAQRELGKRTREEKASRPFFYEGTDPVPVLNETMDAYHERIVAARQRKAPKAKPAPKMKQGLIPYAGKPRLGADHGLYGQKPGPKLKPGRPRKTKP